jgi:hypothetical protein
MSDSDLISVPLLPIDRPDNEVAVREILHEDFPDYPAIQPPRPWPEPGTKPDVDSPQGEPIV